MRFAQLNISVLQEYATVDFSIVLLQIILVSCVHRYYIQTAFTSVKMKIQCNFVVKLLVNLVLISRFTYVSKNNIIPYLHDWNIKMVHIMFEKH